jgi:glycosyltransferase involved in cell wall biosynthesis
MKICLLSDQYARIVSGIGLHTTNIVKSLSDMGHDVTLVCNEKQIKGSNYKGFRYVYMPPHRLDVTHGGWFSLFLNSPSVIRKLHEKYGFDIFHSLDARQGGLVARNLPLPSVGNVNDYYFAISTLNPAEFYREYRADWIKRYLYYNFTRFFEKMTLHNFDVLIANSEATRQALLEEYGLPPEKVVKIHKALYSFPEKKNEIKEKKNGDYAILMVGTNLQRKGVFYMIDASKEILSEFPNCHFHVVGRCNDAILDAAKKAGVLSSFHFHGVLPREEVSKLYRQADMFILPSIIEGFGVALLEAMSYGIPSIGSASGGMQEIIKDGSSGIIVKSGSGNEISRSVLRLLRSRTLRERLSKNAFSDARKFDFASHTKKVVAIYESLL